MCATHIQVEVEFLDPEMSLETSALVPVVVEHSKNKFVLLLKFSLGYINKAKDLRKTSSPLRYIWQYGNFAL